MQLASSLAEVGKAKVAMPLGNQGAEFPFNRYRYLNQYLRINPINLFFYDRA